MKQAYVVLDGPLSSATLKAIEQFWEQICAMDPQFLEQIRAAARATGTSK